eukprot:2920406-Lingulodinium_polyedra.AAC.1
MQGTLALPLPRHRPWLQQQPQLTARRGCTPAQLGAQTLRPCCIPDATPGAAGAHDRRWWPNPLC